MIHLALFLALLVLAGVALRRLGLLRPEAAQSLNKAIVLVFLPALVFHSLHGAQVDRTMLTLPLLGLTSGIAGVGLGALVARLMRLPRETAAALMLAAGLGNTTYFGYPVARALLGETGLRDAILFDLLGATLSAHVLGSFVASTAHGDHAEPAAILLRLVKLPALWAVAIALLLGTVALPPWLDAGLGALGSLTVPLTMVGFGLSLELGAWRENGPLLGAVVAIKLLAVPALVWVGAIALHLAPLARQAAVLEGAMPTMFLALNLATHFELDAGFLRQALLATTLAAIVTAPMWLAIAR